MGRVAIVVVTYNSASAIGDCLDALARFPEASVVVVDNASADATREIVAARAVRLIANDHNAGFAAAVNQGVRATSEPLVLLVNPDARVERGIDALAALFDDPGTGAAGGVLIGADGAPQTGFMARNLPTPAALLFEVLGLNRLWPGNPVNWHYRCLGETAVDSRAALQPWPVEQPAGAFLMFSRTAWNRLGGFDERFWPIWFEDVDFCARLKAAGFRVYHHPAAVATHIGAHSIDTLPRARRERYWYGSLLCYAAKFFNPLIFRVICSAVVVGSVARALIGCVRGTPRVFAVYGSVCRLAVGRMIRPEGGEAGVGLSKSNSGKNS